MININEDMIVNGRGIIDDIANGYDFKVFYIKISPIYYALRQYNFC